MKAFVQEGVLLAHFWSPSDKISNQLVVVLLRMTFLFSYVLLNCYWKAGLI